MEMIVRNENSSVVECTFSSGGGVDCSLMLRDSSIKDRDSFRVGPDYALIPNDFALIRTDVITDVLFFL